MEVKRNEVSQYHFDFGPKRYGRWIILIETSEPEEEWHRTEKAHVEDYCGISKQAYNIVIFFGTSRHESVVKRSKRYVRVRVFKIEVKNILIPRRLFRRSLFQGFSYFKRSQLFSCLQQK